MQWRTPETDALSTELRGLLHEYTIYVNNSASKNQGQKGKFLFLAATPPSLSFPEGGAALQATEKLPQSHLLMCQRVLKEKD